MSFAKGRLGEQLTELVGVRLPAEGVLADTWLDLQKPGLYAMYGANGAGKTTVLDRVAQLFSAEGSGRGRGEIHLRLRDPSTPGNATRTLQSLTYRLLEEAFPPEYIDVSRPFPEAVADSIENHLGHAVGEPYPDVGLDGDVISAPASDEYGLKALSALAWGIARQGRLVLTPAADRGWRVWAATQLSSDVEPLRRIFQHVLDASLDRPGQLPAIVWDVDAVGEMLDPHATDWVKATVAGSAPPGWAALPIWYVGEISERGGLVPRLLVETHGDPRDVTANALVDMIEGFRALDGESVDEFGELEGLAEDWSRQATNAYGRLLQDSPGLELAISDPLDWERLIFPTGPRWSAHDRWSLAQVALEKLSRAERRWADIAIQMTVDTLGGALQRESAVVLLDEPEQALHRRAERHLVQGLKWYAEQVRGHVLAATHSPILLADEHVARIHVRRDDRGLAVCEPIGSLGDLDQAPDSGGLDRMDIVQLTRTFLLVEGAHDETVLDVVIGEELREAAVEILKIDGAKKLPQVFSSGLLLRATDARIVVVLDNLNQEAIDAWTSAKAHAAAGDTRKALASLAPLQASTDIEATMLYELARQAIESRSIDRLDAFGLSKPDIMEYLPPAALGLRDTSWEELVREWRRSAVKDFKQFLRGRGAKISVTSLREAASSLDAVPQDFIRLLAACR